MQTAQPAELHVKTIISIVTWPNIGILKLGPMR